jgi:hypothetical protein
MKYTVRFAHMESAPKYKIGDTINQGDPIGIMGTSGQSTAIHLHIDCARGEQKKPYQLYEMDDGDIIPAPKQLLYFIDKDLFGVAPLITTTYAEFAYFFERAKVHHGFDVVPIDRKTTKDHYAIKWNRTNPGKVSLIVDDPKGYGHCIYITYEG